MPIDTSIYGNIQQPQIQDPLNALAKVSQIKSMQNQNRLADLAYGTAQREQEGQNALADAYKSAVDPTTGAVDRNKLMTSLAQGGQGAKLPGIQKQFSEMDAAALTQQKAKLENTSQQLELVGRYMTAAKQNPAMYPQLVAQLREVIPGGGKDLPDQYDPSVVDATINRAMSVKESIAAHQKDLDFQLEKQKFGETVRNNRTQNGIAAANLGVAQSNLGLRQQELQQKKLTDKAPTEFQGKSATFGARAEEADRILSGLQFNPAAINAKQSVESVPLIGGIAGPLTNKYALSADDQKAEQAQRDFINATLRQESGAAISPSEFENAKKQYFPQPGDKPETIAQKARNRKLAIQGFKNSAGRAAFSAPSAADGWSIQEVK